MMEKKVAAELTPVQLSVVLALVDEGTILGASRKTGVGRSTIYHWLNHDQLFRREVGRARAEVFEAGLDAINGAFEKAVRRLEGALDHGSAGIRLKAAVAISRLAMEMREGHQIEEKLKELEERAGLVGQGEGGSLGRVSIQQLRESKASIEEEG